MVGKKTRVEDEEWTRDKGQTTHESHGEEESRGRRREETKEEIERWDRGKNRRDQKEREGEERERRETGGRGERESWKRKRQSRREKAREKKREEKGVRGRESVAGRIQLPQWPFLVLFLLRERRDSSLAPDSPSLRITSRNRRVREAFDGLRMLM